MEQHTLDHFRDITKTKMSDNNYLNEILTEICTNVYHDLIKTSKKKNADHSRIIDAQFYPYTNLKLTIRCRNSKLNIRLSDLLTDAPKDVLISAAYVIISKHLNVECPSEFRGRYREYIYSKIIRDRLRSIRKTRCRNTKSDSKGEYFDLDECFKIINRKYFHGTFAKPNLAWSKKPNKYRLGHCDSDLNTIIVSRRLDKKNTPQFMVEYIIYHELLHLKHPGKFIKGRWRVHTSEFSSEEKKFENFNEVKEWLKTR